MNDPVQLAHRVLLMKSAISQARFRAEEKSRLMFTRVWGPIMAVFRERIRRTGKIAFSEADRKKVARVLLDIAYLAYDMGIDEAMKSLGFRGKLKPLFRKAAVDIAFALSDEEIMFWLEHRSETVADFVMSGTAKMANETMVDVLSKGGTINQARQTVASKLGEDEFGWRSFRVVNTEFQVAISSARFDMYRRSGVRRKSWLTVGDDRVRPGHHLNETVGWIPIDREFPNGGQDPGSGPDPFNCRCVLEADLSDPNTVLVPWDGSPSREFAAQQAAEGKSLSMSKLLLVPYSEIMKTTGSARFAEWNMAQMDIMKEAGLVDPDEIMVFGELFAEAADHFGRIPTLKELRYYFGFKK